MSADSYQVGFARGEADGEDRRPQAQPGKDLWAASRDPGYLAHWEGYLAGFHSGDRTRRAREQAAPA